MEFYRLIDDHRFATVKRDDDTVESQSVHCPIKPGHQRGSARLSELSVILPSGSIGDFLWTWYNECIITDKVANLLKCTGLIGYHLDPVAVSRIEGKDRHMSDLPKFWELRVRGWAGMAAPESGIRLLESCEGCGHLVYSSFNNPSGLVQISQWDESDILMVWPLPRYILVSDRVREVILANKLQGGRLVPVDELPFGPKKNPLGKLCPGRLRRWMPEDRARELGEPLGIY